MSACCRSRVENAGSNPAGGMDACLLWILCVVRYRSMRRADHSSRGVIPTVMCHCAWPRNIKNLAALTRIGLLRRRGGRRQDSVWKCGTIADGSSSCLVWRSVLVFACRGWGKYRKTLITISCLLEDIIQKLLQYESLHRYSVRNLWGVKEKKSRELTTAKVLEMWSLRAVWIKLPHVVYQRMSTFWRRHIRRFTYVTHTHNCQTLYFIAQ